MSRRSPGGTPPDRGLGRRAVLLGGLAVTSGCAAEESVGRPTAQRSTGQPGPTSAPSSSPSQTPAPRPRLPRARPWTPTAQEVDPEVKLAATRVLEALGTDDGGGARPRDRLTGVGADPALAAQAGPLVPPTGPSVTRLVYPQYGGLLAESASVMAVVDQTWIRRGARERRTVTCDVRLRRGPAGWAVTELRPVRVGAVRPTASGPVARLLASDRVVLPPAAVLDATSGLLLPALVDTVLGLAQQFRLAVTVFASGHPENVYGSDSLSNHTRGRAVDIWAIDDVPVVTMPTDSTLLLRFLRAARALGSDEIGGPVAPADGAGVFFTNALHRDHVHVGFDP